jgi:hypothetical protein
VLPRCQTRDVRIKAFRAVIHVVLVGEIVFPKRSDFADSTLEIALPKIEPS